MSQRDSDFLGGTVRTKLSVCNRKARYASEQEALAATGHSGLPLRAYRCDRCWQVHLTSRTKGKWLGRRDPAAAFLADIRAQAAH